MSEDLITEVQKQIALYQREAQLPKDSLERLSMELARRNDLASASEIDGFLSNSRNALAFFRALSTPASIPQSAVDRLFAAASRVAHIIKQSKIATKMTYDSPFFLFEGLAYDSEESFGISGPFFAVAVAAYTGPRKLLRRPDCKVYLFTQAAQADQQEPKKYDLRVVSENYFIENIATPNTQNPLYFQLKSVRNTIQTGDFAKLFDLAVRDMTKFAFGPGSSETAQKTFVEKLREHQNRQAHPV